MKNSTSKKLFVLDTSVLLFDHLCLKKFKSHDLVIPIQVLEELDTFKVGSETKHYEARKVIRFLDGFNGEASANEWLNLGKNLGRLCIGFDESSLENSEGKASSIFGESDDNSILDVALKAKQLNPKSKVILVTKDINLRIKARTLGLYSQDYLSGKVENLSKIKSEPKVIEYVDHSIIEEIYKIGFSTDLSILKDPPIKNSYYVINSPTGSVLTKYESPKDGEESGKLVRVEKQYASNIKPKNSEQTFALDALLNPDIKLVALEGPPGSGKTLLSLAAAIESQKQHKEIILARPLVSLSNKDIGFLPGSADDKISPYMQPLYDNLKFIRSTYSAASKKAKMLDSLEEDGVLSIMALAFIRGRSISDTYFIIDECFTKDHMIWTEDGKCIPIQDLKNNTKVLSADINRKSFTSNLSSNFFSRKTKELVKIKTTHGIFETTPTHNWWVYENGLDLVKKKAKDLTDKDLIIIQDKMPHVESNSLSKVEGDILGWRVADYDSENFSILPDVIWNAPLESIKCFLSKFIAISGEFTVDNENLGTAQIKCTFSNVVILKQIKGLLAKFEIFSTVDECNGEPVLYMYRHDATKFLTDISFDALRGGGNEYGSHVANIYEREHDYPIAAKREVVKYIKLNDPSFNDKSLENYDKGHFTPWEFDELKNIAKRHNVPLDNYFKVGRINEVINVTLDEEVEVYDFEVEDTHTFIVDGVVSSNCQNLTPHEVKTIVTRAGENTKIIFTGDIHQIDAPYMDQKSNGLSYLIDKFLDNKLFAHIKLKKGERSELANLANKLL